MVDAHAERALELMSQLLAIDSPSGQEAGMRTDLTKRLLALGLSTETDSAGNLYGRLAASRGFEQAPTILLNCHMDTVPTAAHVKPQVRDGILFSDGTTALGADDKGGITALLVALESIIHDNSPHGAIVVLFTVSEETGLSGARQVDISRLGVIDRGYTLDASGPVGTAMYCAPFKSRADLVFHGKSAHAGFAPEKGISAISLAARAIDRMNLLRIDDETTANIGSIQGGAGTNIVCDRVEVVLETRSRVQSKMEAQISHMRICCEEAVSALGGSVDFHVEQLYPGYQISSEDPSLAIIKLACEKTGLPFRIIETGGGSDANILRTKGIPLVVLSVGYKNPHTNEECFPLVELDNLLRLLIELLTVRETC
jgi:tripeptide aminopeptidase